ncbi:MAG: hypothetical protein IJQ13_05140 [Prevotella sp.]|nr:hypothetical protein [Prevotella sp.]
MYGSCPHCDNKCYLQLPATFEAETTGEDFKVKIAASGKSSFAAPYDLDFTSLNDDLKAFTATGYDKSTKTIWLTRVKKVQKGEGLLLKGDANKEYTIPSTGVQASYVNMIIGNTSGEKIKVYEKSDDNKWTNYYLSGGTYVSVVGNVSIGNNKSYLQLPTEMLAGVRSEEDVDASDLQTTYDFVELETESMPVVLQNTTGIEAVQTTPDPSLLRRGNEAVWYDVQGRKYDSQPTKKGLYIHNGKKVVIRSTTK